MRAQKGAAAVDIFWRGSTTVAGTLLLLRRLSKLINADAGPEWRLFSNTEPIPITNPLRSANGQSEPFDHVPKLGSGPALSPRLGLWRWAVGQ